MQVLTIMEDPRVTFREILYSIDSVVSLRNLIMLRVAHSELNMHPMMLSLILTLNRLAPSMISLQKCLELNLESSSCSNFYFLWKLLRSCYVMPVYKAGRFNISCHYIKCNIYKPWSISSTAFCSWM